MQFSRLLNSSPLRRLIIALLGSLALLGSSALLGAGSAGATALVSDSPQVTTAHFRFYEREGLDYAVRRVADDAEGTYARLCAQLGACDVVEGPIDVWVALDADAFAAGFHGKSPMAEWAAGVAFIGENRVVLRAHGSALFSLVETFEHEVSHIIVHAAAGHRPIPRWLSEGLAIWQSGEEVVSRVITANEAAVAGRLLSLNTLERDFPRSGSQVEVAYAQSALFVRQLIDRQGIQAMGALLADVSGGEPFHDAFFARYGNSAMVLADAWRVELESNSSSWMLLRDGSIFWIVMVGMAIWAALVSLRTKRRQITRMGQGEEEDTAWAELAAQREAGERPTLH